MSNVIKKTSALVLCSLVLVPISAMAQEKENMVKIAEMGGGMHAIAEECGDYTAAQLKDMKAGQQSASAAGGLSAAEFETVFTKSYEATKVKIAAGTASQKKAMCEQANQRQN